MGLRSGSALGALVSSALVVAASSCSSDKVTKSESTDGGSKSSQSWTTQAFDVQSTWHNTKETKLTKDNAGTLAELWKAPLGLNSTVTVVGKRVFTSSASGITALDTDSKKIVWRQSGTTAEAIGTTSSPTYDEGKLFINNGTNGTVYSLDAETGKVLWKTQVETHPQTAGYSSPIVSGDRIYFGVSSNEEFGTRAGATFRGSVVALDKKTGDLAWKFHTAGETENGCAVWSTVALDPAGGTVFAVTGNNYTENPGPGSDSVFAIDMEKGTLKWHKQVTENDVYTINTPNSPDSDFGANPVVFDYQGQKLLAAGQKSGELYVFNRENGDIVKQHTFGNGSTYIGGIFQSLAWDGRHLYVVNNRTESQGPGSEEGNGESFLPPATSVLFALDPLTLDIVWERQLPAWVWAPLTIANGLGFLGAEKTFQVVNLEDGQKLYDFKVDGTIIGAPVVNDGRVYFPSGLQYFFGHPDDKLHVLTLPDDPAVGKPIEPDPEEDLSQPTLTNVYKAVISKNCIDSQCHGATAQGGLRMNSIVEAGAVLLHTPACGPDAKPVDGGYANNCKCGGTGKLRVVPGKPDESLLMEKLDGNPSCGDRMPPTGEPLPQELRDLVRNWIAQGAQPT